MTLKLIAFAERDRINCSISLVVMCNKVFGKSEDIQCVIKSRLVAVVRRGIGWNSTGPDIEFEVNGMADKNFAILELPSENQARLWRESLELPRLS